MRKLFVKYSTGYCGMDGYEVLEFPEGVSDEDIDKELYFVAVEHAQSYGIEVCPDGDFCEDDECEYEHEGSTNISACWEDYIPEKHDMFL